ncbi:MAG: hypothetical protein QME71_07790 [Dehalococcoidia bacterium]|nr:hypothetical protein [Dehalococcoidia bacterium]
MDDREQELREYERRLADFSASLPKEIRLAAGEMAGRLSPEQLRTWAEEGIALAGQSLRSWEAAIEYFRASPKVIRIVPFDALRRWTRIGRELADHSSIIAAAYFQAGPECAGRLSLAELDHWAAMGRRLYQGNWKSVSLASLFFSITARLLDSVRVAELQHVQGLIEILAERSYELAGSCLEAMPRLFSELEPADRKGFVELAHAIVRSSWADARNYCENGPNLVKNVEAAHRARFMQLAGSVADAVGPRSYQLFAEAAAALGRVEGHEHPRLLSMAEDLAASSPIAAMEFLKSGPEVLARIDAESLGQWHAAGTRILRETREGGEAFFRLQSGKGEEVLERLSHRVDLSRVSDILRLYCKALTGANVCIHPSSSLAEKGIGWVASELPSTEGTAVYLPPTIEEFESKKENFAVYKVYATHQAGHLEFGSFLFNFKRRGNIFSSRRRRLKSGRPTKRSKDTAPLTDMERFFDLFPDRRLAADLFTITEDARVDFLLTREYPGIRRSWRLVQQRELARRPPLPGLPLRQAFLENLVRASIDGAHTMLWPRSLEAFMIEGLRLLHAVRQPQARVEDSAEAALRLYELTSRLPNLSVQDIDGLDWELMDEESMEFMLMKPKGSADASGTPLPTGTEEEYESPQPVEFRGDFKPELVQLLMRLRLQEGVEAPEGLAPLTPEQLKELLEKSVEISIGAMAEGDLSSTVGLFLTNLEKEAGTPIPDQKLEMKDGQPVDGVVEEEQTSSAEPEVFWYDEWDFRASDYRPRWCRVLQRPLEEGEQTYYEETLQRYSGLAAKTRKQFEQLRPELFRKIKRLHDGEDFDIDLVIDYLTERRTGHSFTDKVYWRRNKIERQVAVAFLLDMSASTDEEIEKRKQKYAEEDFGDDPRRYYEWLAQRKAQAILSPPKRIIDLEKESIVLLISALEAIGDAYGIYGFSGYGRENVEFYVLKDLDEPLAEQVRARIDKVAPIRSTRMGPAIRHATSKLEGYEAKVRILFLVSDGRPQDHGYGRDRTEREYAIHDTHQALLEAKRKGIVPFCLTVDKEGHDYLGQMCEEIDYEVLGDIEALPDRLPTLYRRLTE